MKYYLRGFGIGVIFVTILFLLIRKPGELTDTEVESRAARLGMLTAQEAEEKRLSAIRESELKWKSELEKQKNDYEALLRQKEEDDGASQDNSQKEDQQDGTPTEGDAQGEKQGEDQQEDNDNKPNENSQGEDGQNQGDGAADDSENQGDAESGTVPEGENPSDGAGSPGIVKIEVLPGMHAGQVASLLEENGIIENAEEFQRYLKEQNKQTLIQVGTFELRQGEDFDAIIDVITGR